MRSCGFGAITLKVLPGIAIGAIKIGLALGRRIVLLEHIADDFNDLVRANANAPAEVLDGVIYTLHACVADTLHGISAKCAHTGGLVALAHVNRICRMTEVEATGHLAFLLE
jgi:hypothetical protein